MEGPLVDVRGRLVRVEGRLGRMEGRLGDLEGSDYECKLRYGLLHWSQRQFGLDNAYLALTQNDPLAPQLSRSTARATGNGPITAEESEDLYLADIIMSDQGNRHVVVEASITLGEDDINRAKRRASILAGRLAVGTNTSCSSRDQVRENLTTRRPGPQSPGWTT